MTALSRKLYAGSYEKVFIIHAARNDAVDLLAIVPFPPQLIFQLYTFSTGERARVRGEKGHGKRCF